MRREITMPLTNGVSAIITMETGGKDLYMFQRRGLDTPHYPGWLGTFGGKVEEGETALECLYREMKEELGWVPTVVHHLGDFGGIYPQPNIFPTEWTHAMLGMYLCPMEWGTYQKILREEDGMGCFEGQAVSPHSWEGLCQMQDVTYPVMMGAYLHRQWKRVRE